MRDNRCGAEITVQSMLNALEHRNCVLHMWTPYERWYYRKQEVHLIRVGFVLPSPNFYIRKGRPHGHRYGKAPGCKEYHTGKSTSKEVSEKEIWQHPRPIHPRQVLQKKRWLNWGRSERDHPRDGSACKRKQQSYCHQSRNWRITVATGGLARTWWISIRCQQGINLTSRKALSTLYPPQESGGQEALWKVVTKFLLMVAMANKLVGNLIMRIHHKDGVTTDWTGKPVYSVGNYSFAVWISATIECTFDREYIGYSWQQSTVTDGGCKYNTSWYRNSRTNDYDKWLRKSVYDRQARLQQRWDHCGQLREWRDARRPRTKCRLEHTLHAVCRLHCLICSHHTPHGSSRSHLPSIVIPSMDMRSVPWAISLSSSLSTSCRSSTSSSLSLMTDGDFRDNQQPARPRERDLRHPGRLPPPRTLRTEFGWHGGLSCLWRGASDNHCDICTVWSCDAHHWPSLL